MNSENLYIAVGNIDEKFISESAGLVRKKAAHSVSSEMYHSEDEGVIEVSVVRHKKNGLKIMAVAVAVLVAAGAAAAVFGTKKDKNEYKDKKIENYFREDGEFDLPEKIIYVDGMYGSEDSLYISAQMVGSGEVKQLSAVRGLKDRRYQEADLSEYGSSAVKVFSGRDYLYYIMTESDNVEVSEPQKNVLVRADRKTGTVKDSMELAENEWVADIKELDNGSIDVYGYVLTDLEISDYSCVTYDSSLKESGRKEFADKKLLDEGQLFFGYLTDSEDGYYTFYRKDDDSVDMYRYSSDGNMIYLKENVTEDMQGIPQLVFLSSANKPALAALETDNKGKSHWCFDEYDSETGEVTGRYESSQIEAGYIMTVNTDGEDYEKYDFVFLQDGNVYGYEMRYDELTEICIKSDMTGGDDNDTYINCASVSENEVIFSGSKVTGDNDWGMKVIVTDPGGSDFSYINMPESSAVRCVSEGTDGMVYILVSGYDQEAEYEKYSVIKADKTGEIKNTVSLECLGEMYSEAFIVSENGTVMTNISFSSAGFFDGNGKLLSEISVDSRWGLDFFRSADECFTWYSPENGGVVIEKIDFEKKSLSEVCRMDYRILDIYDGFGEYDAVIRMDDGLYGYSFRSGKMTEIINWADSDLTILGPAKVHAFSPDLIAVYENSSGIGEAEKEKFTVSGLKRVSDDVLEKIQQRKIINIAVTDMHDSISEIVRKFNTENENCRIHIENYSKYASDGLSYMYDNNEMAKLSGDIASGKIPDMIIFSDGFDRERFCCSGVFEDLNEYFERDSDAERSDFFENILDAYSTDGKQYSVPVYFNLMGMVGKRSVIGDDMNMSYDRLWNIEKSSDLFAYLTYEDLKAFLLRININEFVDYTSGTCSFDSREFTDLIGIIKKYGISQEEIETVWNDEEENSKIHSKLYNDICALEFRSFYSFKDYTSISQCYAPIDPVFTGLPGNKDTGFTVSSSANAALFRSSENKDEAWSFIKMLLSEDFQINSVNVIGGYMMSFPVRKSAYDSLAETSKKSTENSYTSDITGKHIKQRRVSNADIEAVSEMIASVSGAASADHSVQKIIDEQLDLFIADQQTAEETAAKIQNKVSLYLKEIK